MRYPFLNFLRYAQLVYGMTIVVGGFFIAVNAGFNNPFALFNENYLEVLRDRGLTFTSTYLAFCFFALVSLAIGDFIKLFINVEDHLRALRNDSETLVKDDTIREELVRSELYTPIPPRWYERIGDAILTRLNAEIDGADADGAPSAVVQSKAMPPARPTPGLEPTQPVQAVQSGAAQANPIEAANEVYKEGVRAYRAEDYKRAHALFEQALAINPDHPKARDGLRAARKKLGDG